MADFGTDINFLNGLDPLLGLVDGTTNLGQALVHRLTTPHGSLFYDPNYGTDLRAYCNDTMTQDKLAAVRADVQAECLKDERVISCLAEVGFDFVSKTLSVNIVVQTADEPFALVLAVTSVTVELLRFTSASL
jgi:phage baseplate assembly protein W